MYKQFFGKTKYNEDVFIYTLKNDFLEVQLSNYGAAIRSLKVLNKTNCYTDVVLGYDDVQKYENQSKYIGATIGRCCNRLQNGELIINEKHYHLNCNDGKNHLHGGNIGFDKKNWLTSENDRGIEFSYISKDLEENYPGNLEVKVNYYLKDSSLIINYCAKSDKDTVCNLTNHSYFNLAGEGDILNQYVQIFADSFTENNSESLPTGKIISVEKTPMDFRIPKKIGQDIKKDYYQLKYANGFDNNWIINNYDGTVQPAAKASCEESGITLEVYTDLPGIQFYSGNFLDGAENGKNNTPIKARNAFCLECQYFPNFIVNKNFPQPVIKAGEVYNKTIEYRFS